MGYIYKFINIYNDKVYIGQTIQKLKDRKRGHFKKNSNCRALREAMTLLGEDGFSMILICECANEDLDRLEAYYIHEFNSLFPNGYNLRQGGNGTRHSLETRQRISDTLKVLAKPAWNKGISGKYKTTAETKSVISQAISKYVMSPEHLRNIQIRNLQNNKAVDKFDKSGNFICQYANGREAAADVQVSFAAVSMNCTGKRKTVKGFVFRFAA